jgi:hypothetical protein
MWGKVLHKLFTTLATLIVQLSALAVITRQRPFADRLNLAPVTYIDLTGLRTFSAEIIKIPLCTNDIFSFLFKEVLVNYRSKFQQMRGGLDLHFPSFLL